MGKSLTDMGIRNLPAAETRREIADPGARGLYVIVQPSGMKSFAVRYRYGGKTRKLTLAGGISLAAARRAAADALYEVQQGRDPGASKQQAKRAQRLADENTFRAVAEEYFKREGKKLRTVSDRRSTMERLVYPTLGNRPIADIRRSEIVGLLDKIEEGALRDRNGNLIRGGAVMAHNCLAYVRKIFNWHAARSDDFRSPIVRGMSRIKPREIERDRVLSDDELRAVWKTADAMGGPFARWVQFTLLTASRKAETAEMQVSELSGTDWTLPAARNKSGQDLVRPLSEAALDVLARTPSLPGCEYVFSTDGVHAIGGFSRFKERFDKACGVAGWRFHDLRRTARSLMSRAGVPPDHAERCLGHVIPGVRGTYDRHKYYEEKRDAYNALARTIFLIVEPRPNVIPFRDSTPR